MKRAYPFLFCIAVVGTCFAQNATTQWVEVGTTKVVNVVNGQPTVITTRTEVVAGLSPDEMAFVLDERMRATAIANSKPAKLVEEK